MKTSELTFFSTFLYVHFKLSIQSAHTTMMINFVDLLDDEKESMMFVKADLLMRLTEEWKKVK